MTNEQPDKPSVQVRVPGSQKFTPEQTEAIAELLSDLREDGYDATYPRIITASATLATLEVVGIYIAARGSKRIIDKVTDDSADWLVDTAEELLAKGIAWARKIFAKNPRQDHDEPPRTTRVIIFGPDKRPLKSVEVVEDDEDGSDGNQSR